MALTMHVCAIAAWMLYNQFGFAPMAPGDDLVSKRYDRALEWLDGIGKKTITPIYLDSSGSAGDADRAGDFVISDQPVGFTNRGTNNGTVGCCDGWFW